mmetsp:Transcript_25037/g.38334  ORF Transcript_25037/g.38334 Transcript_25037/m.38334 type:complete len:81 (+) Transcript_25037:216-458(+)
MTYLGLFEEHQAILLNADDMEPGNGNIVKILSQSGLIASETRSHRLQIASSGRCPRGGIGGYFPKVRSYNSNQQGNDGDE